MLFNPYLWLAICFVAGAAFGIVAEYFLHWLMHRWTVLGFHIGHHKEYFKFDAHETANRALHPRFDVFFFSLVLGIVSPLLWWSFWPVLFFWMGTLFHIAVIYEGAHWMLHYDTWLPAALRNSKRYRWWKACHHAHHRHSPAGNYCVTYPQLDWMLGTYVHPKEDEQG